MSLSLRYGLSGSSLYGAFRIPSEKAKGPHRSLDAGLLRQVSNGQLAKCDGMNVIRFARIALGSDRRQNDGAADQSAKYCKNRHFMLFSSNWAGHRSVGPEAADARACTIRLHAPDFNGFLCKSSM